MPPATREELQALIRLAEALPSEQEREQARERIIQDHPESIFANMSEQARWELIDRVVRESGIERSDFDPGVYRDTPPDVVVIDPFTNAEVSSRREPMPASIADRIKNIREKEIVPQFFKTATNKDVAIYLNNELDEKILATIFDFADEQVRPIVVVDISSVHIEAIVNEAKGKYEFPLFIFAPNPKLINLYKERAEWPVGEIYDRFRFIMFSLQIDTVMHEEPVRKVLFETLKQKPESRVVCYTDLGDRLIARIYPDYVLLYVSCFTVFETEGDHGNKQIFKGNYNLLHHIKENYNYFIDQHGVFGDKISPAFLKRTTEGYINFVINGQQVVKQTIEETIKGKQQDMQSQYKAIVRLERELSDLGASLRSVIAKNAKINKTGLSQESIENNFKNLFGRNGFKKLEFQGADLVAYTNLISVESHGKSFDIGEFRITMKHNGEIYFRNLTNRKGGSETHYDHPHIKNEIACFGNIKEYVPRMLNEGEYIDLLTLLLNYLKSYTNGYETSERPWVKVEQYWGRAGDYCPHCQRGTPACSCLKCPTCNKRHQECPCEKCNNCAMSFPLCEQHSSRCGRCRTCHRIEHETNGVHNCICPDRCAICRQRGGHYDWCVECSSCHKRVNVDDHDFEACDEEHNRDSQDDEAEEEVTEGQAGDVRQLPAADQATF